MRMVWIALAATAVGAIALNNAYARPPTTSERGSAVAEMTRATWNSAEKRPRPRICNRCSSLHDQKAVGRWASKHFPDSYAGMYVVPGRVDRLIIGFTERQSTRVQAAKQLPGLAEPQWLSSFPYVPQHSLLELDELQQRILQDVMLSGSYEGLFVSVGVAVPVNIVEVGAARGRVQKARKILRRLYGPEAPIRVRYEETPVEV